MILGATLGFKQTFLRQSIVGILCQIEEISNDNYLRNNAIFTLLSVHFQNKMTNFFRRVLKNALVT